MITNLKGRLKNTSLPFSNGLLPLFEAVVNSIHGIEEAGITTEQGVITVEILRNPQQQLLGSVEERRKGPEPLDDIQGFRITDNGIGFTQLNMSSFDELDTEHKADQGCRGVGRLLWLKAFKSAEVESTYKEADGKWFARKFVFSVTGVSKHQPESTQPASKCMTSVSLLGFKEPYRKASRKTAASIARSLFEHCLWYFVRPGGAPSISIVDGPELIDLDQVCEAGMLTNAKEESFEVKGESFTVTHIRLRAEANREHIIGWCAGRRLVREDKLRGCIPGLFGPVHDADGDFCYAGYVTSTFLDEKVRAERTGFDFEEDAGEFFGGSDVALSEVRAEVLKRAGAHLESYLTENRRLSRQRVEAFTANRAPRYRPILDRIPEERLQVDPDISDKDLDLLLHKQLAEIEGQLLEEGHQVMVPTDLESAEGYRKRLQEYLSKAEDLKKSDLANYVFHRKVIIDVLEKALKRKSDGRYSREDVIHNLIMPMGKDSNEVFSDEANLWLMDERLAFHNYLGSDKTIHSIPITGCADTKEPDICALNIYDNPLLISDTDILPQASLTIVEIKRPMRDDAREGEDKDPIEQSLDYLERIREGKVTTADGRPIPESRDVPGFCYIVCDITPSIKKRCRIHDAIRTPEGDGYFFFHKDFKAYVEVISFDRLVNMAKKRNKAFFDKLGLPTS